MEGSQNMGGFYGWDYVGKVGKGVKESKRREDYWLGCPSAS